MDQKRSGDRFLCGGCRESSDGGSIQEESSEKQETCQPLWMKNGDYRNRVVRSIWLWLSFFSMGVANGQRGPAFLDIQRITETTLQQAASFFTVSFVGSLIGSLVGGVAYDVISRTLLLSVSLVTHAVLTVLTPFCRQYVAMAVVSFLVAVCGGGVSTALNADVLRTWEGASGTAMQGLHFSYALGGVIAPLVTQPFLAPSHDYHFDDTNESANAAFAEPAPFLLTYEDGFPYDVMLDWQNATRSESSSGTSAAAAVNAEGQAHRASHLAEQNLDLVPAGSANGTRKMNPRPYDGQVQYAYLISSVITFLSALPFLWMFLKRAQQGRTKRTDHDPAFRKDFEGKSQPKTTREAGRLPSGVARGVLAWTCCFFVLYYAVERAYVSFLAMFVVKHFQWPKEDASLLTSAFWTSLAVARFCNIFLVRAVSLVAILVTCCAVFVLAVAGMLMVAMTSPEQAQWSVWACVVLTGAATAAIVPTALTWLEGELLRVTGRTLSLIALTSSLGSMANPLLLGYLMESHGALWFCYVLLGEAIASVVILLCLLLFPQRYLQPRFESRCQRKSSAVLVVNKSESDFIGDTPLIGEGSTEPAS